MLQLTKTINFIYNYAWGLIDKPAGNMAFLYARWAKGMYNEQRYISKLCFVQKFFNLSALRQVGQMHIFFYIGFQAAVVFDS